MVVRLPNGLPPYHPPFLKLGLGVFVAGDSPQQTPQIHLLDFLAAGFSDFKKSLHLTTRLYEII